MSNEKITISRFEFEFLKYLNNKDFHWIARNYNSSLFVYELKPTKQEHYFHYSNNPSDFRIPFELPADDRFEFINWNDDEATRLEDILSNCEIAEFNVDEYVNKIMEINSVSNQSIVKYGKEPQCRQAMEECAELIQAINKCIRYSNRKDYRANLIEEIADVEIMLYQLKVMFNVSDDEVFETKMQKAKREQERLDKL